jgi:hypothetical protein
MADSIIAEPKSIEELVAQGYRIRPMHYLREGWRTFTRYPNGFLGFALLFTVTSQAPLAFAQVYGQFFSIVLQVIMMAGIAMVVWKQMRSEATSFTDFFPPWETIGQLILCTIVGVLFIVVGLLLFIVPGIYLIVAYTFAYMLIIDRGLTVWQALEASRRVVNKNWWKVAGLSGLMVLLMIGGTAVFSLVLGLPLGMVLSRYYPDVSLSDLPFGPPESNIVLNMGMTVGVLSGALMGLGLGTALSGCMYGVAYADIFGLTTRRGEAIEPFAQKLPTVTS